MLMCGSRRPSQLGIHQARSPEQRHHGGDEQAASSAACTLARAVSSVNGGSGGRVMPDECAKPLGDVGRVPSQPEDQIADGGRFGQKGVVAGVDLHDAARLQGKLALQIGGSAAVLGADEVGRGHLLPGR
jgi:hypothetical protein